jgi:hypothetical protein
MPEEKLTYKVEDSMDEAGGAERLCGNVYSDI